MALWFVIAVQDLKHQAPEAEGELRGHKVASVQSCHHRRLMVHSRLSGRADSTHTLFGAPCKQRRDEMGQWGWPRTVRRDAAALPR